MFVVEVDCTVVNLRIIRYFHLRDCQIEVAAVLHQLFQRLAAIEETGCCPGRNDDLFLSHFQQVAFFGFGGAVGCQTQYNPFSGALVPGQAVGQRSEHRQGEIPFAVMKESSLPFSPFSEMISIFWGSGKIWNLLSSVLAEIKFAIRKSPVITRSFEIELIFIILCII